MKSGHVNDEEDRISKRLTNLQIWSREDATTFIRDVRSVRRRSGTKQIASPKGRMDKIVSSKNRVKSKPCRQERATVGPQTFSTLMGHPALILHRCILKDSTLIGMLLQSVLGGSRETMC